MGRASERLVPRFVEERCKVEFAIDKKRKCQRTNQGMAYSLMKEARAYINMGVHPNGFEPLMIALQPVLSTSQPLNTMATSSVMTMDVVPSVHRPLSQVDLYLSSTT
jgi:hypothetical protein